MNSYWIFVSYTTKIIEGRLSSTSKLLQMTLVVQLSLPGRARDIQFSQKMRSQIQIQPGRYLAGGQLPAPIFWDLCGAH